MNNEPLLPGHFYHVYNRANGSERLFRDSGNYFFFFKKYHKYISPVADMYSYCLMPNHFHFCLKIKSEEEILENFPRSKDVEVLCSKQFSNFFSSYSQAYNKINNRMGSLFMKNFKRKIVNDEDYFRNLVSYIHHNPVEANIVNYAEDWMHSSYSTLLADEATFIKRNEVFEYFGTKEKFVEFHEKNLTSSINFLV